MARETPPELAVAVEGSSPIFRSGQTLRPAELGRLVGLSASQIRTYERLGFLPPAERTASGQRRYGAEHADALRTSRTVQQGYGWQRALDALAAVHRGASAEALAVADERHADVAAQRRDVGEALEMLHRTQQQTTTVLGIALSRGRTISIGRAATALGLRTSAIRYWESRGVLRPPRAANGRRSYGRDQLRRLQLIKVLRQNDYDFDAIGTVVNSLDIGDLGRAERALVERQTQVEARSRAVAAATRALLSYLERYEAARRSYERTRPTSASWSAVSIACEQ